MCISPPRGLQSCVFCVFVSWFFGVGGVGWSLREETLQRWREITRYQLSRHTKPKQNLFNPFFLAVSSYHKFTHIVYCCWRSKKSHLSMSCFERRISEDVGLLHPEMGWRCHPYNLQLSGGIIRTPCLGVTGMTGIDLGYKTTVYFTIPKLPNISLWWILRPVM